jgi:flavin reductase (DIM6/NTAB) family NADH-FMN oxidoreductase RutF
MKTAIGAKTFLYPMPTTLIGALAGGRPNYMTVAYCGIANYHPAMIAIGVNPTHRTTAGIEETGVFSVNLPSAKMVEVTDYCGLVTGAEADKSGLFTPFYGTLEKAPMIQECPLTMECRVSAKVPLPMDALYIAEIVEVYADPEVLENGLPHLAKLDPILFSMGDNTYWKVGDFLAKAWSVGKGFQPKGRA